MISSSEDTLKYINDKIFKKIFVLCGKKSFVNSGAENLLKNISNKEIKLFYKKSEIPILEELIEIIKDIKLLTETLKDFEAYSTLLSLDFLETKDSRA